MHFKNPVSTTSNKTKNTTTVVDKHKTASIQRRNRVFITLRILWKAWKVTIIQTSEILRCIRPKRLDFREISDVFGKNHCGVRLFVFMISMFLFACTPQTVNNSQSSVTNVTQTTTSSTPTYTQTATPQPTSTTTPTSTATSLPSTPTPCPPEVCAYPGHFFLARPIGPANVDVVDPTYRYGSNQGGARKTHHGVEFVNSQGTPVLAAANGTVIVAGNDTQTPYADFPVFYGNLVIIEHNFPGLDDPIFTVYGHLYEVQAEVGQQVSTGDQIGLVGFTGAAIGEHLHFEVRYGENSYRTTRNPELWLQPHHDEGGQPHGIIAGRLIDEYGGPIPGTAIRIDHLSPDGEDIQATYYVDSYADWTVNGDDIWQENFVLSNIPAGKYRVSFVARGLQSYDVYVQPGMVTLITFDARELGG